MRFPLALSALFAAACASAPPPDLTEAPIVFQSRAGVEAEAFEGSILVPENRADPQSRMIPLRYVRFPATGEAAGAPIVYLAGGPGGSGIATAKGRRHPLFMAMREFGDVIALDQRGTGASGDTPRCVSSVRPPSYAERTNAAVAEAYRASIRECAAFWEAEGVDVAGYTTAQSVHDLEDLRRALGAEKLVLWGTSYGSHLALAAMKDMDGRIEKVVLSSAEGLDQTVKLPARTDAYFDRLQAVADADPVGRTAFPDIQGLILRVHDRLEAEPVLLTLARRDGSEETALLDRIAMRQLASGMIADPHNAVALLNIYRALEAGVTGPVAEILGYFPSPNAPISWRPMPLAMDVASGIGDERLALVEQQAETALLGAYLNFPMPQVRGELNGLDLGDRFRQAPKSRVPTLLLSGTLDGRTYTDGQLEAVAGLSRLTHVEVVNAGHNLFMSSPEVRAAIETFMRGEPLRTRTIKIPPPSFEGFAD